MKKSSRNTSISKRRSRPTPKQHGLARYFKERQAAFLGNLESSRRHFAVEGIHELRVETKRLRALYRLAARLAPEFPAKKHARVLQPLFRAAGSLRDIDIHQAIALPRLETLDLREYFNHLKQIELDSRITFEGIARPYAANMLAPAAADLLKAVAALSSEQLRGGMTKRTTGLSEKLLAHLNKRIIRGNELHDVRKLLKELRYVLDMYVLCNGKSAATETAAARLKKAYGHLGDWRDAVLTLSSVAKFLKRDLAGKPVRKAAYKTFRSELKASARRHLLAFEKSRPSLKKALQRLVTSLETGNGNSTKTKRRS